MLPSIKSALPRAAPSTQLRRFASLPASSRTTTETLPTFLNASLAAIATQHRAVRSQAAQQDVQSRWQRVVQPNDGDSLSTTTTTNLQKSEQQSTDDAVELLHVATAVGCVDVVNKLTARGTSADAKLNGVAPIAVAVQRQDDAMVRALLNAGARASGAESRVLGVPLLQLAASLNAVAVLESLVRLAKVAVDERGPLQWTALHAAAARGHCEAVRALLVHGGADLHAVAADGSRPLDLAARAGHAACVRMLLASGAVPAPATLSLGVVSGSVDVVATLLAAPGVSASALGLDCKSPLSLAVEHEHADVARLLVAAGARFGAAEQLKLARCADAAAWLAMPHEHARLEHAFRAIARAKRWAKTGAKMCD